MSAVAGIALRSGSSPLARVDGDYPSRVHPTTGHDFPPPLGIRTGFYDAPRTASLSMTYGF